MEINDYESDFQFGRWLKDQRIGAGLTLKQAALHSGIGVERLNSLELGYAERGINRAESEKISAAYNILLKDLLSRAAGTL